MPHQRTPNRIPQDNRSLDRALAAISAGRPPTPPRQAAKPLTLAGLVKHAERFGIDGVLYTAWEAGLSDKALTSLAEKLDEIRVAQGRFEKNLSGRQLARQVEVVPNYLR